MCNMGRKNKRDPQAKLTVEFFDLSRKSSQSCVSTRTKEEEEYFRCDGGEENGGVQIRLMLVDREMSKSSLKCIKKALQRTKTQR